MAACISHPEAYVQNFIQLFDIISWMGAEQKHPGTIPRSHTPEWKRIPMFVQNTRSGLNSDRIFIAGNINYFAIEQLLSFAVSCIRIMESLQLFHLLLFRAVSLAGRIFLLSSGSRGPVCIASEMSGLQPRLGG